MNSPRQFDLIVFDWDGTLFDSTALITRCIQSACADVGVAVPSDSQASYVIGMGLAEALQHAAPSLPRDRYRDLAERYRHHYVARQHELVFFDGTLTMLQDLRALRSLFDATRTADETASKPDPRMLIELMDEFQVEPARTLMIGDTTHDLQLAANAGTASIGVSYGAHDHASFDAFDTRHVAHSTADLHDWLLRHG
jgi:phosphoglycolate phosphatase